LLSLLYVVRAGKGQCCTQDASRLEGGNLIRHYKVRFATMTPSPSQATILINANAARGGDRWHGPRLQRKGVVEQATLWRLDCSDPLPGQSAEETRFFSD
jgi:hypothetical protein